MSSDRPKLIEDIVLSRRGVMAAGGGALARAALLPFASRVNAQEKTANPPYEGPLKDFSFTDQHGKEFVLQDTLAGKPHLLVFGYEGCPYCEGKITQTVAAVQRKTGLAAVVVTIHAKEDEAKLREYAEKYSLLGVRQLPGEGREDGKAAFDAAAKAEPSERSLHILITRDKDGKPSNDLAIAAHRATGQAYDADNPNSHTPMIMLCDEKGKILDKKFAAIDPKNTKARDDIGDAFNRKLESAKENPRQRDRDALRDSFNR